MGISISKKLVKLTVAGGISTMLVAGLSACNGKTTYSSDSSSAAATSVTSSDQVPYQAPQNMGDNGVGDGLDGSTGASGASGITGPTGDGASTAPTASTASTAGTAPTGAAQAPTSIPATQVAVGSNHACALLDDGTVRCWGDNAYGELGDGTQTSSATPVAVKGLSGVVAIAAGGHHSCALEGNGLVYCWGMNAYGQLGDGVVTPYETAPVEVIHLTGVKAITIATGGYHTCALTTGGAAKCWGNDSFGQLGSGLDLTYGRPPYIASPAQVAGLTAGVDAIVAGYDHTCALISGSVECWGANNYGQLGNQLTTASSTDSPVGVITGSVNFLGFQIGIPLAGIKQLSSGVFHTCALNQNGNVLCWGRNGEGELGRTSVASSNVPTAVVGVNGLGSLDSVKSIGSGSYHSCAVLSYGQVRCWGAGQSGQLGDGAFADSAIPTSALASDRSDYLNDVTQVSGGRAFSCVLSSTGQVSCFGANDAGQLSTDSSPMTDVPAAPLVFGSVMPVDTSGPIYIY